MKDDIERFLRTGEGDFDRLALELFVYQFQRNARYHVFCEAQGATLASVKEWRDIPSVPISSFKSVEFTTFPSAQAAAVFHSSATTTGTPSRHFIKDLRYYETALKSSFEKWVLVNSSSPVAGQSLHPKGGRGGLRPAGMTTFFILTPSPAEAPHSSLSWMMDVLQRTWGGPGSDYFVQRGRLDEPRLDRILRKAEKGGEPVIILGTTIAFLAFYDYSARNNLIYHLPSGSRIMDTGGMKTQKREVSRADFVGQMTKVFGIPEEACFNEYGMCEMGSQFYGTGASTYLKGPPWVRTLIIDPVTGRESAPGQEGLLRHFDLANVDSVMAIQTEDVGVRPSPALRAPSRNDAGLGALDKEAVSPRSPRGREQTLEPCLPPLGEGGRRPDEGFHFLGRSSTADLKGCSLAAENYLR